MTTRTKKLALVLTGAVALSSGAYALGSQSGDGGALASSSSGASGAGSASGPSTVHPRDAGFGFGVAGHRGGPGGGPGRPGDFGLDALASRLGVTTTALRDALESLKTSQAPDARRADFIQKLATALGKPVDQVTSAFDSVVPDRTQAKDDAIAAFAKALGVDPAKVQTALDKVRSDLRAQRGSGKGNGNRGDLRDAFVNSLATELGVSADKVRSAFDQVRSQFRDRGRDHRADRQDGLAKLATALGVTQDQLRKAFDTVATQERDEFATALAQKLNIDVQKVKDAFADLPRFGPGFGRRHG